MGVKAHKQNAPKHVDIGIITVSTTRTKAEDKSGKWISKRAAKEGHRVIFHEVIPDDSAAILNTIRSLLDELHPQIILVSGGTGISHQDVTIETVRPLFEKELTGFGALFAQLSFEEIDSAAIMSRATAGVINTSILFCIPGSLNACKLACKSLIFPEIGHLVKHLIQG
ncbi:MAG: molybdenum cofactor biosynthesis protein MoaB [Desulfobacterales bacterium]|nr:molybdenum cofactor biosynthesis protein MoaB [Desulfobacterales bacterium]